MLAEPPCTNAPQRGAALGGRVGDPLCQHLVCVDLRASAGDFAGAGDAACDEGFGGLEQGAGVVEAGEGSHWGILGYAMLSGLEERVE